MYFSLAYDDTNELLIRIYVVEKEIWKLLYIHLYKTLPSFVVMLAYGT